MTPAIEQGFAALLAGLPDMGPSKVRWLLDRFGAEEAWARATSGTPGAVGVERLRGPERVPTSVYRSWASQRGADPLVCAQSHTAAGVEILLREDPRYPQVLLADPAPPAVLFAAGRLPLADGPRAAVIGTRRCTGTGAGFARELGAELTAAGVAVVSGLALGIDAAAHRGALDACTGPAAVPPGGAPIGVVGSGLDVVYPARHRDLWEAIGAQGTLLSEAPIGARPTTWRFPARNRLIAGLADVVVVVESHAAGGSMLTVDEAEQRGIPVLAAPGSVRSAAAAGTNRLLAEGCHPVRDVQDVLVALDLATIDRSARPDRRPPPGPAGTRLLDAFDWEPVTLEHLVMRVGSPVPEVAVVLHQLLTDGWVQVDGPWYERVSA